MGRAPAGPGATAFRFTPREVVEMERALEMSQGLTPARGVTLGLAENFSMSAERAGQKPIQWKQVWNWFQNRRHSQKAKIAKSPEKQKSIASVSELSQPKRVPAPSAAVPSGSARSRNENQQMEFEAKSARDGAWYDVSTFISHRVASTGDPEVRVRFAGFGSEEDEWVNVRNAVRQRSLPCEASECVAVLPGDLILCFQEGNEQALYFDADILDVQRRRHDVRGCRCRFWVRYGHDQSEEVVPLRKVCRRPETEYRLLKLQSYGKNNVMSPATEGATPSFKPDPPPSAPSPSSQGAAPAASSAMPKAPQAVQPEAPAGPPAGPSAGPSETVMAEGSSSSAMAVEAVPPVMAANVEQVQAAADPVVSDATAAPEQPSGAAHSAPEVKEAAPTPMETVPEPERHVPSNEAPSLQAPPEMFDESDSIVVLDRSALEAISK